MREHIRNYERPDGWSSGHPEVLVAKNVIKKLGDPVVNYDSLHEYLTDDIGLPYDSRTFIKLFGRSGHSPLGGFHYPYTRSVYVNAVTAENLYALRGGTMRVVAHELRHRCDSTNRKAVTAMELAARWASYKAGLEVSNFIPLLSAVPAIGAVATRSAWYILEPPEKRARNQERELIESPHQADILFPNFRAVVMTLAGLVPQDTAEKLGNGLDDLNSFAREADITVNISDGVNERRLVSDEPSDNGTF